MSAPPPSGGALVLLDGGLATELQRAGVAVREPWWTAAALRSGGGRRLLRAVHRGYLAAGARVITANTFRCNLRALRRAGAAGGAAARLVHCAVEQARAARDAAPDGGKVWIAGSLAPVEDCYRPDLVPADAELRGEHRWLAGELLAGGADLVLIETMSSLREARIALEQVVAAGGRAWVSFVCGGGARLLSGERLADAAGAVERDGAGAVLVNCTAPGPTEDALRALRAACDGPIGAYPNVEDRSGLPEWTHVDRHLPAAIGPGPFAELLARWREELSVEVLGGCCGASPAHVRALGERLGAAPAEPGPVAKAPGAGHRGR